MSSKLYDLLYSVIGSVNKAVRTETQVLTDSQKSQARANIGALGNDYTPPTPTAQQVGADPAGTASNAVSSHNTATGAHEDIRALIANLTTRLNTIANSTDTDLDQLAELVDYIKDNRTLIDQITTGKVSVADIVNNLTTNVSGKPLSAAQGVVLKGLIDTANTALAGKPDLSETEINTLAAALK